MSIGHTVMSAGSQGGQGIGELIVVVITGVLFIAFLVLAVLARRRDGKPAVWLGLAGVALVVGVLTVSLS